MAALILPNRWAQQPQGPVDVNLQVPGLSFASLPGQALPEIVSRRNGVIQGSSTRVVGSQGQALQRASSALDGLIIAGAVPIADAAPYSIFVLANPSAESLRSAWFFVGTENGENFQQINFGPNMDNGGAGSSGSISLFEFENGFLASAYATSVVDGKWHVFGVRRYAGSTVPSLFCDGRLLTNAASTASPTVPAIRTKDPVVGGSNLTLSTRGPSGTIAAVCVCRSVNTDIPRTPAEFWGYFFRPINRRLYFGAAAAGGTTVTPSSGALVLTGNVPTVVNSSGTTVSASAGALALTGNAPSVSTPVSVSAGVGALALTGKAPTVSTPVSVSAGVGALVLTGNTPTITVPATAVSAGVGALVITGNAPTVTVPTAGVVTPSYGVLTITGNAPQITVPGVTINAGVGSIVLTGNAPTVGTGVTVTPNAGALSLTGYSPTVVVPAIITPDAGAIILTGWAPTVTAVTLQTAVPTTDISAGGWLPSTGSDLFAMVDESIADDVDYDYTNTSSTMELKFGSLTDPSTDSDHYIRYRIKGTVTIRLMCGASEITNWVHSGVSTETTFSQTLTAPQAAAITDYTDLRLKFEA